MTVNKFYDDTKLPNILMTMIELDYCFYNGCGFQVTHAGVQYLEKKEFNVISRLHDLNSLNITLNNKNTLTLVMYGENIMIVSQQTKKDRDGEPFDRSSISQSV